nr:TetR/AcrR family transcriptional regulator [Haloferula luteola]
MEAAQELFALNGFDRVAVRDVTEKAGANVAAVNYHFGSREGLVEKVIERYITPINEERLARLDELERRVPGKMVPLEDVIEAFVRPFLTQVRRSELSEKLCLRLIGRLMGDHYGQMPKSLELQFQLVSQRFKRAFERVLPGVAEDDLVWRGHFMAGSMVHAMANGEMLHRLTGGVSGAPSMELTLSRFVKFAAAGMRQWVPQAPIEMDVSDLEDSEKNPEIPQSEFLF